MNAAAAPDAALMMTSHAGTVLWAFALSALASLVGLDFAARSAGSSDSVSARLWIAAGAAVMGTGIWAMHFVGMSAADYPFKAAFEPGPTLLSWALAVLVCMFPVGLAAAAAPSRSALAFAALVTGAGAASMHFLGSSALAVLPSPRIDWWLAAAAFACASLGSALALGTLAGSGMPPQSRPLRARLPVAASMGGSLAGMHFLAMAAEPYFPGSVCTSRDGLDAASLSEAVGAVALAFLAMMMGVSGLERRAQRLAGELRGSLHRAEAEVARVSARDSATGLPNRLAFQEALQRAASQGSCAVLMVELDDFARASRLMTADAAAAALLACARRVLVAAGQGRMVASAGGCQFLILAEPRGVYIGAAEFAQEIAAQVATAVGDALVGDGERRLTVSMGIAIHNGPGEPLNLVGDAAVALEAARSRGGDRCAFFEPGLEAAARADAEMVGDLRLAISRGELELHYQPKVHARSGRIAGAEALLRWRHPARGRVGPNVFIPLAERFGLIEELGDWVLGEAVAQMARWAAMGRRVRVAVNVSPGQLLGLGFAERVATALARHSVDPKLLTCEITESGAMREPEAAMEVFSRLRESGVGLSIDDFGTGHSSLSLLRKIPLRQLKVDRSFVCDICSSEEARSIVQAIVHMARALHLEVVAEGVETEGQRDILVEMGCEKLQGYLFAKPMPAEDLTALMADADTASRQFGESAFAS